MLEEVAAADDGGALILRWSDGRQTRLSAATLRRAARDAASRREVIDSHEIRIAPDLTITRLQQVGAAGLNIGFSDGHDRAIYPFAYLRELSRPDDK
ncbi:MAG: gamma-butyrobetaine hydroxylase-like domain-containing protein [Pseudomonadota bacterium]|nr:hypothetical protein JT55_15110 [Rhodovulum sp. NI22]MDY6860409.1 gamma-butyrobetaine hydroxylase-like domain-containing protein [Pseudomonadota bacterium]